MKFNSKEHMKIKQIEMKADKKRQEYDGFTTREKVEMIFLCVVAITACAAFVSFVIAALMLVAGGQ